MRGRMGGMRGDLNVTQVLARIESLKAGIRKANAYLESGEHADWSAFRPLFDCKLKDGKELPPHKDWVKNVYLRRLERALSRAEKNLWELDRASDASRRE